MRVIDEEDFFLFRHKNIGFIKEIQERLIERGYGVWLAEVEILQGDRIAKKVQRGLDRSDQLVAILTRYSLKSRWVLKEIGVATKNMKKPLTLIIDTLDEKNRDILELFLHWIKRGCDESFTNSLKTLTKDEHVDAEDTELDTLLVSVLNNIPPDKRYVVLYPSIPENFELNKELRSRLKTLEEDFQITRFAPLYKR